MANDTGAALEAVAVACTRQGSAAIDTAAETLSLPAWGSAGGEALLSADGAGEVRLFLLDPRSLQPLCEPWVLTELP